MPFGDHFSSQAGSYLRHRPRYPGALFAWLATLAPPSSRVWEVGAGNGQATADLRRTFDRVLASEPSLAQLARAPRRDGDLWLAATGEQSPLAAASVDLVVVATAAHWLDLDCFAAEVRRVGRPGCVLVVWCYGEVSVSPEVDQRIVAYRRETIDPYWPPGRQHVESLYRTLEMPFTPIPVPRLELEERWNLGQLVGYLDTWSALASYRRATGDDPLPRLATRLREVWDEDGSDRVELRRRVRWPLALRASRVD